eukprot:scaffold346_cov116-Cylindrotheca_fusiformis.AAC.25
MSRSLSVLNKSIRRCQFKSDHWLYPNHNREAIYTSFESSIPTELGELARLETLLLEGNQLSGTIPSSLGDLHLARKFPPLGNTKTKQTILTLACRVEQLSFRKNYLMGHVPEELCKLREMLLVELKVDSWIDCKCCTQ